MLERLTGWDGEFLAVKHDDPSGATFLAGIHSTVLGPGLGGTRMKVYASIDEAVGDVLRLSRAMTSKNAMAGLPFGGGKAVLAVPRIPSGDERAAMLRRYGGFVSSLRGAYVTACDMNTTELDMDVIAERCEHVMGTTVERGGSGTSAPDTALGVYHGIRAALEHVSGSPEVAERSIAIQGTGAVGARLAELLHADGAVLTVADVDEGRTRAVAGRTGATPVAADAIDATPCDVFAPCATGGTINAGSIERLRCSIVAGAANNQLAEDADAARLASRGIVYAPDYVVNAGGVLHLAGYERLGWSATEMGEHLEGIGATLRAVFQRADDDSITTAEAADRIVAERLGAADVTG